MIRQAGAVILLAIGIVCAGALPSSAQNVAAGEIVVAQYQRESQSIFRFLRREPRGVVIIEPPYGTMVRPRFDRPRKAEPRNRGSRPKSSVRQKQQRPQKQQKQRAKKRQSRPAATARKAPPAPAPVVVEKAADAARILVVGDFVAGAMAKGLAEAYADKANVVVVDANNGASGLVRADHFDWAVEMAAIAEKEKPSAVVMLIGSNDRQAISTETGSQAMGTAGWSQAYAERTKRLAEALKATGKPVLWGSLVPVRPGAMSRDYSAMNSVFREALDRTGVTFVDLWNGFADEEGKYIASGPDVDGRNTQLRDKDGINFTRAGQRKLAFFAQQYLDDILKTGVGPQIATAAPPEMFGPPMPAGPEAPSIGPMMPMNAVVSGAPGLSAIPAAGTEQGGAGVSVVQSLTGAAGRTPKLRADNYQSAPVY